MALPERLGRLHVLRRAGTGGFASVWLAHDPALDSTVAVKVLADNWAHRSDVRERFLAEARLLRRVDSDGVVRVYDVGELEDGRPWLSMTYADRGTLADRLPWRGGPAGALALLGDLATSVDTLHRHGIVHRDLAPGNILFVSTPQGGERVVVGDLGLAKDLGFASGLTQPGGTGDYRAPEQLQVSDQVGPATDVYALSVLAGELLGTAVTPAQDQVLARAQSLQPEQRPTSAGQLVAELAQAARTPAGGAPMTTQLTHREPTVTQPAYGTAPVTQPGDGGTALAAPARRRTWLVAGALLVLLLLAVPLGWWAMNRGGDARIETPDGQLALTTTFGGWERTGAARVPESSESSGVIMRSDESTVALAVTAEVVAQDDMSPALVDLDCLTAVPELVTEGSWTGLAMVSADCGDGTARIVATLGDPDRGTVFIEATGVEATDLDGLLSRLDLPD